MIIQLSENGVPRAYIWNDRKRKFLKIYNIQDLKKVMSRICIMKETPFVNFLFGLLCFKKSFYVLIKKLNCAYWHFFKNNNTKNCCHLSKTICMKLLLLNVNAFIIFIERYMMSKLYFTRFKITLFKSSGHFFSEKQIILKNWIFWEISFK